MSLYSTYERLVKCLQESSEAKAYLTEKRGISERTIDELSIGFCDWNSFHDTGINLSGRITFPIKSIYGDVVGFGGRILGEGSPKYLNSPSSEIYDKSRSLYNIDIASDYILHDGKVIVVEGYMDAVSLWDAGIRNVVATCGTAITRWQVRALKRFAEEIYLLYDDDTAGQSSASKAIAALESERFPVYSVRGMMGLDPDEYVKMVGKESLIELIDAAKKN